MEDNHVHTNYCPHGSSNSMEEYVRQAINSGIKKLTFTEHAPLVIADPTPEKDSAMSDQVVLDYINEGKRLKEKYKEQIEVNTGFEVDFIEGEEAATKAFLTRYKEAVPYSILSVHFLRLSKEDYFCIDYSKDAFIKKAEEIGYAELYERYRKTLQSALKLPYGELTPKTIGHITLINKFTRAYAYADPIDWQSVLDLVKKNNYQLDYNFAGFDKKDYQDSYPPEELMRKAIKMGVSLSTGSDAHHPKEVGRYFERSLI